MTDQVLFEVFGNLGVITLNRPKALNALTTKMCKAITKVMIAWQDDERIGAVLVRGAGDRAFCAGGDVVMLHDSGKAGDGQAEEFWRVEYALNELIYRYHKPYIALIDGIVMGGGVGLSVHGRLRVAGDTTLFAMPETGIGYFPDVGGTYFLPRLGRAVGNWLGLTGARLKTPGVCALGIANAYVPSDRHPELVKTLGKTKLDGSDLAVINVLMDFVRRPSSNPEGAPIYPKGISAFGAATIHGVFSNLQKKPDMWSMNQLASLNAKSPLALATSFAALERGGAMKFRDVMSMELDLSLSFLNTSDFYEGIRAQLIDKDRKPVWSDAGVGDLTSTQVSQMFTPACPPLKFLD